MTRKVLDCLWLSILSVILALAITAIIGAASAQEHQHGTETITGARAKFYETWMRPDNRSLSCCNRMDCDYVLGVRHIGGQVYAQRRSDGRWLLIPPQKIETERDAPDAMAHLCSMGDTVYCFVESTGG